MALPKEVKERIIQEHRRHEKDTGSPEVQIAILTEKINRLTEHLKKTQKGHTLKERAHCYDPRKKETFGVS